MSALWLTVYGNSNNIYRQPYCYIFSTFICVKSVEMTVKLSLFSLLLSLLTCLALQG